MKAPAEFDPDALKVALRSVDTLLEFRAYGPGALFVILLGKFRDDLREALQMSVEQPVQRGTLRLALDDLDPIEIAAVGGAVMILRQQRFTDIMDDPMLPHMLESFEEDVSQQKFERANSGAGATADAGAS